MTFAMHDKYGFNTRAIKFGCGVGEHYDVLRPAICNSPTYASSNFECGERYFAVEAPERNCTCIENQQVSLLENKLADLEGGAEAVIFGSGIELISKILLTSLKEGDEILFDSAPCPLILSSINCDLIRCGVKIRHVDMMNVAVVERAIGPATRVIYFETPARETLNNSA